MNFGIGLSAIQASQFAINNVSHNLANAGTEGYHRQEAIFRTNQSSQITGRYNGTGVQISELRRFRSSISESAYTNATSDLSRTEQSLLIETRIETLVTPGEGSIQDALNGLFDGFARLSANPGEVTLRDSVLSEAGNLTSRLRQASAEIVDIQASVGQQIELEVQSLNLEIEELVALQNRISSNVTGQSPNDLLDNRDQLINRIAERVDVQRFELVREQLGLGLAGNSVAVGTAPFRFETVTAADGTINIQLENGNRPVNLAGGRIAALLEANNDLIKNYGEKMDELAGELIQQFDQLHAAGIGIDGSFSTLQSARAVSNVDLPLAESAAFPMSAGELFLTITSPSGERRTTGISVDPAVDSLQDVATRISGIDNVQALVDDDTGRLSLIAVPGFEFDFTGRLESNPDLVDFSGAAVPQVSGSYTGDANETLRVTAVGSGIVGKTPGLKLQIANADGDILNEINVGDGYVAGSPIDIGQGVTVSLSVGDVTGGDAFNVVQTATADTSGLLSAIGLNNFFTGTDATNIEIDNRFRNSSGAIATTLSGEVSDTRNLEDMVALRDSLVLSDGRATFESYLEEVNTSIGFRVQTTRSVQVSLSDLKFEYQTERDAISGVDVNEELISLSSHQKNYEAAIQVVRTMESMLDDLFQMIR
jgi:flagellar hook-associated protein FlgK